MQADKQSECLSAARGYYQQYLWLDPTELGALELRGYILAMLHDVCGTFEECETYLNA